MIHLRAALLVVGLAMPLSALAQGATAPANLQQQMSAGEFKAAGLDKLSAAELAALNAWLNRAVGVETAKVAAQVREQAREEGRKEVVEKNRGFLDFGSSEPIVSNIQGTFRGFGKGRRYTLANGQVWEQTDGATLAGANRTDPKVSIKPGMVGESWYLRIDGFNTSAKVKRVK